MGASTLRGTLLLRMATLETLATRKASSSVEGSLPSSLAKRYFDCQKTKERAFSLPGKLPAPSILREFCFEIWERESAPAELSPDISGIYGRLMTEPAAENIDG